MAKAHSSLTSSRRRSRATSSDALCAAAGSSSATEPLVRASPSSTARGAMLAVMAVKQWARKASAPVDTPGLEVPPLP
jgi:hypothetical protein